MQTDPASTPRNSILKNSITSVHASSALDEVPSTATEPPVNRKGSPNPRHLTIALHHARHIQARKDAEALILLRIETLMEFPVSGSSDASNPSAEDVAAFKSYLLPFQPSDYDNLILERNIDGRCGYTLCPNPHRREDPKTKFRILWGPKGSGPGGQGREMNVVPREKLEMWCSDTCAERAMYIRVQLNETPSWERTDTAGVGIKLLDEARRERAEKDKTADTGVPDTTPDPGRLAVNLDKLQIQEDRCNHDRADELAIERGEVAPNKSLEAAATDIGVVETEYRSTLTPSAPVPDALTSLGGSIEGLSLTSQVEREEVDCDSEHDEDLLPYL